MTNALAVNRRRNSTRTRDGSLFDPSADLWSYRDNNISVSLDYSMLNCTDSLRARAKAVLRWYAENKSPSHLVNLFYRLAHFLRTLGAPAGEISDAMLLSYRALLPKQCEWYFGTLVGLLLKWRALGHEGITDAAVDALKSVRSKGNTKGTAVLTLDSHDGPLTDVESLSINAALRTAIEAGMIADDDYLLAQLFILLGQRPIQYASLKVVDLKVVTAHDGTASYVLSVPRAKQRGGHARLQFKKRLLAPAIGERLQSHCMKLRERLADVFADTDDIPMFPAYSTRKEAPPGFHRHRTANSLSMSFANLLRSLKVNSERTGKPLHVTATRFRRTIGTRAAIEGHGELVIAELLDHNDTQNVGVYTQAVPQIIERIDRAVAMHLAPLAQAFAGVLIDDESKASRKDDPTSRICGPHIDPTMRPMGSCGQHGFCGLMAPIACYTCRSFQPWRDGPHEAVLQYLLDERERFVGQTDVRIASVNDRTILAVAEVVRLCAEPPSDKSALNG